jgi:hypothetical protein
MNLQFLIDTLSPAQVCGKRSKIFGAIAKTISDDITISMKSADSIGRYCCKLKWYLDIINNGEPIEKNL